MGKFSHLKQISLAKPNKALMKSTSKGHHLVSDLKQNKHLSNLLPCKIIVLNAVKLIPWLFSFLNRLEHRSFDRLVSGFDFVKLINECELVEIANAIIHKVTIT